MGYLSIKYENPFLNDCPLLNELFFNYVSSKFKSIIKSGIYGGYKNIFP